AVNGDGTHWWDSPATGTSAGQCDESCQRWVSACVLARTNAYGVPVEISMRAPATPPRAPPRQASQVPPNQCAPPTRPDEVASYTLREGAYYGNIFATTPEACAPDGTQCDAGVPPPDGGGPNNGPVVDTPSFYACAGPGSNIPEITKRFCSSQGDQVVIN